MELACKIYSCYYCGNLFHARFIHIMKCSYGALQNHSAVVRNT
ncbi:MAG: hypothetical protein JG782_1488 [Anaerophaga sp.]|nr:hypothetical protein [Anaerophaga sp.]MDK2842828.1 hypothetical protein [Anaerophaga sp.]